ncbi:hypothetical protein MO973_19625 [Paenibacillus sp. TRM 82003]|nr:hypothetical protein [Paenibacillus sp. TRM 82003]
MGNGPNEQKRRFNEVWNSLEPEIIEDLERFYHRLSVIKTEAQLYGVRSQVLVDEMNRRVSEIWERIGKGERWDREDTA